MLGAVIGDIVGSVYEGTPIRSRQFPLFGRKSGYTDDTVLTVATAYAILNHVDYGDAYRLFGRKYSAGYGSQFYEWLWSAKPSPYFSWGNGSAMRVSPVGYAIESLEDVLLEARKSAEVTHNHPEGIKGAQAVALAVHLAIRGESKARIAEEISSRFSYDLGRTLEEIQSTYYFKISCQESVPESIIAFLEAEDFVSSIRNAVYLGGDSDTMACIAGAIAEAFYKHIPDDVAREAMSKLPAEFIDIIGRFTDRFQIPYMTVPS